MCPYHPVVSINQSGCSFAEFDNKDRRSARPEAEGDVRQLRQYGQLPGGH